MRSKLARLIAAAALLASAAAFAQSPYQLERIGLYGPEFTAANNTWSVSATRLSLSGVVAGTATRYQGFPTVTGTAPWRHEGGVSVRIGYTDAAHTDPNGFQVSAVVAINAAGQCIGSSTRYLETGNSVSDAWLATVFTIAPLGLTDPDHTHPDDYTSSSPRFINDADDTTGTSRRYSTAGANLGTDGWLRHDGIYTLCALTDADHTASNGARTNTVMGLAASGQVTGFASRYNAPPFVTNTAWLATPGGPVLAIGPSDPPHIAANGQQLSEPIAINASGMVIGRAFRYQGNGANGESAWIHQGGVTTRIGLIGPGYVTPEGFEYAVARRLNDRGDVLGQSTRWSPLVSGGSAVWVYADGVTRRAGLIDPRHTDQNGLQNSMPTALNARGDAIGTSNRYAGPVSNDMGWYYDVQTHMTHELVFSQTSTGDAHTVPSVLLDTGVVLGSYSKYSGDAFVGTFAFRWSLADGLTDLEQLADGGLPIPWTGLSSVSGATVPGAWNESVIVGFGRRTGETSSSAMLLRAVTPACDPDFNCDGNPDQDDVLCMINAVAGNPGCECQDPDFNRDGSVDQEDVAALINAVAGGSCP